MKVTHALIISLLIASCSPTSIELDARSNKKTTGKVSNMKLTKVEREAQAEARIELSELPEKFAMDDAEIDALVEEGLLTEEELAALKIAQ